MTDRLPEDDISPTFCIMPWSSIATSMSGGYKPCCWIYLDQYNGSVSKYVSSDYLNDIKDTMLRGEWHSMCIRCKTEEIAGTTSKRKRENEYWRKTFNKSDFKHYEGYPITSLDLRLSNTCNLLCISCNSLSSSSINHETRKNLENTVAHYVNTYKSDLESIVDLSNPYSSDEIDKLVSCINEYTTLYFTGGEPSLVKEGFVILSKLIENGLNKKVILKFNSNFQTFNSKWIDLLSQFSGVMSPSIDAVGKRAEFIRYGSDWTKIENNFKRYYDKCKDSYITPITPTVSILNIFYLHELIEWSRQFNDSRVTIEFSNRLDTPRMLCLRNLSENAKVDAIKYLKKLIKSHTAALRSRERDQLLELIDYIKEPAKPSKKVDFVSEMDKLDKIRNTNWRQELPELSKYYEH